MMKDFLLRRVWSADRPRVARLSRGLFFCFVLSAIVNGGCSRLPSPTQEPHPPLAPTDMPSPTIVTTATAKLALPNEISPPVHPFGPTSAGPLTYTIQWGDGLSKIAQQFGVTNEMIIETNPGLNPNLLVPGQVVNIPAPGRNIPSSTLTLRVVVPKTYTIQRGDWFYAIARKFDVSVTALMAANPGINPNLPYPGEVINIPGAGSSTRYTSYTVQPGDTLFSIALRFGTTTYALEFANYLPHQDFVFPGMVLVIPK